jgi:undecaprenyl diphosphate synthase
MDGNGRWAKSRGVARVMGHRAGRAAVRDTVEGAIALGVEYLTLYTFSTENWGRPALEVEALMTILSETLRGELDALDENGVRLGVLGRLNDLPRHAREVVEEAQERLSGNRRLQLNLALSYSGRAEIVEAARRLAEDARSGRLDPAAIDNAALERHLETSGLPDPDLLIRTSGEMRISNFMLWQLAYTEIWITDVLWPDFRRQHLFEAVAEYQGRHRRFGRVE